MPTTEIATITEDQLKRFEEQVRKGSAAFIAVGTALAKIREGKGYRLRGFDTFEAYCATEFGITDRHGRRLIQGAETAAAVKRITGESVANESVAREFVSLTDKPEQLKKVTEQLEKKGFSVVTATAEMVKEAVQRLAPKPRAVTPGNGQAVVVPGNGRKVGPITVTATETSADICPHCGETPNQYIRSGFNWTAACCGGGVTLSVSAWPPKESGCTKLCPACGKPAQPDDPFCSYCGEKL